MTNINKTKYNIELLNFCIQRDQPKCVDFP
jgi:hypothetical protein